jgi:BphX-like
MNRLKWWFRAVGAVYLLLGLGFVPALNAARLPFMLPGLDSPAGGVTYRALLDFSFMFGLDLLVTGAYLLAASSAPQRHLSLVWLVVALEVVRGILDDVYMIASGYGAPFYLAFIGLHIAIISTGLVFARQAAAQLPARQASAQPA